MKITTKLVAQVKKHNAAEWHDHSWWGFERLPEVEAINIAMWSENAGDTLSLSEIVEKALTYLKAAKATKLSKTERYAEEF